MPIFQSAGAPPWTWLAANSGTRRTMTYVRHDISLTRGDHFFYGIPGEIVNDVVLRRDILASNYIYRFDYDSPGLRVRRLAIIQMSTQNGLPGLAMLSQGTAKVSIQKAQAYLCQGAVHLDITWAGVQKLMQSAGVFVHGISTQGQQVFVADRDLLEGYLPLDVVPSGVTISETRVINTTPDNPAVSEIRLGVYSRVNGERFTATQDTGVRWDGDEVVIPVGATGTSQSCDQ